MTIDLHNPSFQLFPVNNNRTAWRPVALPVIMVVPHRYDMAGAALPNSVVSNVRVYIEDVPKEARVAGHQHIGQRFPDRELYAVEINALELGEYIIDLVNATYTNIAGESVDYVDAVTGDTLHYTTATGVTSTLEFVTGAEYYDLSRVTIEEIELLPVDRYNIVYSTNYLKRVLSQDDQQDFLCIDVNTTALAVFKFEIDHPGQVLNEFYRLTPPPYLTDASLAADTTIALYRPFTDVLQDVVDEQDLMERINWVFDAPAEAIPYLSALLGWDLPYFPRSLDQLRRAVLRRTVEFQNLKGSRRAIVNIFRLFGFEILISNLWWSVDGKRYIRPDDNLPAPYEDQQITTVERSQIDVLLADYNTEGFNSFAIPFLFRPQEKSEIDEFSALRDGGDITIVAYAVAVESEAHTILEAVVDSIKAAPAEYGATGAGVDDNGFPYPQAVHEQLADAELLGFSQINIAGKLGEPVDQMVVGPIVPLISQSVRFNRETNVLTLTLNGHQADGDIRYYAFATYTRYEFIVPDALIDLQSNRFDIQVLTQNLEEFADPVTLEFAVEFLYRLKAFHSLLNVIRTRVELTESYQVTDLCFGGDYEQRYDTDFGRQQVPPAIIPDIPDDLNDCTRLSAQALGYKETDLLYRSRVVNNLAEEHAAWKALDGREENRDIGSTNIEPTEPADRADCKFTHAGQDRILTGEADELVGMLPVPLTTAGMDDAGTIISKLAGGSGNSQRSVYGSVIREYTGIRDPFCTLDGITDYCYKGRVGDELLHRSTITAEERVGLKPILIGMGTGVYWTYPATAVVCLPGVQNPDRRSHTNRIKFSGQAPTAGYAYHTPAPQSAYLNLSYDQPLPVKYNSTLGRLYRAYGNRLDQTIHFSNRNSEPDANQQKHLALQRPSIEITLPIMHFPGCRFATMNRLFEDFTHPTYQMRPWDMEACGRAGICDSTPDYLNFEMVADDSGNERLTFDVRSLTVIGNGLLPDISTLGEHVISTDQAFDDNDVVHKIYMREADASPYVTFDAVCDFNSAGDTIDIDVPLFNSYNQCGTDPNLYTDFIDGYPCVIGYQVYTAQNLGQGIYEDVLDGLGIPSQSGTDAPATILFLLSSGIKTGDKGVRLDGGCLLLSCDLTVDEQALCALNQYRDEDGIFDPIPAQISIEAALVADEEVGMDTYQLDGSIPSMLETLT